MTTCYLEYKVQAFILDFLYYKTVLDIYIWEPQIETVKNFDV